MIKKKEEIKQALERHLVQTFARDKRTATHRDWWLATCYVVRDQILQRFMDTQERQHQENARRVYYFSLEYLMGRLLNTNSDNLGLKEVLRSVLKDEGLDYEELRQEERDMGLGNGGLGRLAACFLDSLATLNYPAIGYGIQYEFGMFRQAFKNNQQEELPDDWLRFGNPWRILRPERTQAVQLYGRVEQTYNDKGDVFQKWVDTKTILGIPWDIPIVGYQGKTINFLRLWESKTAQAFDLKTFNEGGYVTALQENAASETISKVLYPNDKTENGKELRLVQQYFFVSCSLKDILRRFKDLNGSKFDLFPKKVVIQLNDTHPAIAIPELMRLFIDEEGLSWDRAWNLCRQTFAYTNHTLMPEALERWSVPLMSKVLPRHLQIIYDINLWFLQNEVEKKWPGDVNKRRELSIIEEGNPQYVRMSYLSVIASFSVNGVAKLHTELLKTRLFPGFYALYPKKFNNKTNGVTPRRWIKSINPRLSMWITERVQDESWVTDLEKLSILEKFVHDKASLKSYADVKQANKQDLAHYIEENCGIVVNPEALFDVQVKRLHEFKRQHLNLLHILKLYWDLLHDKKPSKFRRVVIFGAKAPPGYYMAKEIIHAINLLATHINHDTRIGDSLKVVFIPNYSITLAGKIIPAADLSEQISAAGTEASGTGNMKLGLNGACTIGTLDGANVEILEHVGEENFFLFGHTVEELEQLRQKGYNPRAWYEGNPILKSLLDWMASDYFLDHGHNPMRVICDNWLDGGDPYFVLADFEKYYTTQKKVEKIYQQPEKWYQMAMLNTARLGYFSSDRTIRNYVKDIWHLEKIQ